MSKQQTLKTRLRFVAPLAFAALVTACASTGTDNSAPVARFNSPEEAVQVRSTERWQHLLANEIEKAYTYLPPSSRSVTSEKAYVNSFTLPGAVQWTGAEFVSVDCADEARCLAVIAISAKVRAPGFRGAPTTTEVTETWIKEDGQWWYYQR